MAVLLGVTSAGCGGPAPVKLPDTVPFTGTVKMDGQPLAKASLTYIATANKGINAVGITDGNGQYKLKISVGNEVKEGVSEV